MATFYVDSGATGTNAGTSWTDAWTSVYSITGLSAADIILMASTHSQSLGTNWAPWNPATIGNAMPVKIISANVSTSRPEAGAILSMGSVTTLQISAYAYFYGVKFLVNNTVQPRFMRFLRTSSFEDCEFSYNGANRIEFSAPGIWDLQNCKWTNDAGSANTMFRMAGITAATGFVRIIDADLSTFTVVADAYIHSRQSGSVSQVLEIVGGDFSSYVGIHGSEAASAQNNPFNAVVMRRVKIASGLLYSGTSPTDRPIFFNSTAELIGCYSGTQTVAAWQYLWIDWAGRAEATDAVYRDGSVASDGAKKLSIALKAHADRTNKNSELAARTKAGVAQVWLAGGVAVTVGIEVAHNAVGSGTAGRLTNHECWATVSHPSATSPAPANATITMLARDPTAVAADLADSALAWTGTGTGTKQKIVTGTITPAVDGYFSVEAFFAPESASDVTIYVCTNPVVTVI